MKDSRSLPRRIRLSFFNTWAVRLELASLYLARSGKMDLSSLVSNNQDASLMKKARLDCDWYAENTRCFAHLAHEAVEFLPAWVCGPLGLIEVAQAPREPGEERWLITMGHQPQSLGQQAGRAFELLSKTGVRQLYYAFDEASRFMACFRQIAPYLDVLIHDESPLDEAGRARLKPGCRMIHRSWVANVIPYAVPFIEQPEEKILFLGSQLGLTPHRKRQFDFLQKKFKDRFVAFHDHSVAVGDRNNLNRFKVGLCPEGRKFTTPAMAQTHTDRPFWSGCLGLVPVSENSRSGDRLEDLHRAGLILRYSHGDLATMGARCEEALAMPTAARRAIYEHYNKNETIGSVVAAAIAAARSLGAT